MFIILASTSKYRKQLLEAAGIHAECVAPEYEEKPIDGMHPLEQIAEFARGKAASVAAKHPNSIIIASDQGLVDGDALVGKPGTFENACEQLQNLRGKSPILATSVVVLYRDKRLEGQNRAVLHFRADMSDEMIVRYVEADNPVDCAGSFKIESRGSRLFSSIECDDPTAIQGLPMMMLNRMLIELEPHLDLIF